MTEPAIDADIGRDERRTRADNAEKSADQSARAAWISAMGAVLSAAVAVPGAVYSYRQMTEISESAKSAAESLKQAKTAVEEARRIADGVNRTADSTVRVADSNDRQASHLEELAARAREQEQQLAGSRRAAEEMAAAARQQVRFSSETTEAAKHPRLIVKSVTFTKMHEGEKTFAQIQINNLAPTDPDDVDFWNNISVVPVGKPMSAFPVPACGQGNGLKHLEYAQGLFNIWANEPMSHQEALWTDAGTHEVVAYGRACYRSGDGPPKMIRFCAAAAHLGNSKFCDH